MIEISDVTPSTSRGAVCIIAGVAFFTVSYLAVVIHPVQAWSRVYASEHLETALAPPMLLPGLAWGCPMGAHDTREGVGAVGGRLRCQPTRMPGR